jgi:hypothetical protein
MAVSQADLALYQGDDYAATVAVALATGSPADLTGYTAASQIRRGVADAEPEVAAEFTCVVQSPLVLLSLTHDETATLNGQYMWDLQLTGASGAITTILRGKVIVTAQVTRVTAAVTAQVTLGVAA